MTDDRTPKVTDAIEGKMETKSEEDPHTAEFPNATIDDIEMGHTWVRPRPLDVRLKDPNLVPRWISTRRLDHARAQGWTPTTRSMVAVQGQRPMGAPEDEDSLVKYADLMLHHMPKKMAEARRRYLSQKSKTQSDMVKKGLEQSAGSQAGIYGKIEERRD
ncbi:MAG: hypothetical protein Q6361_03035 [Candidatus Hermodarchaeota archaeon]|nr:hypothetical protein [Candidatus Hermodarchaeota archaeon]